MFILVAEVALYLIPREGCDGLCEIVHVMKGKGDRGYSMSLEILLDDAIIAAARIVIDYELTLWLT